MRCFNVCWYLFLGIISSWNNNRISCDLNCCDTHATSLSCSNLAVLNNPTRCGAFGDHGDALLNQKPHRNLKNTVTYGNQGNMSVMLQKQFHWFTLIFYIFHWINICPWGPIAMWGMVQAMCKQRNKLKPGSIMTTTADLMGLVNNGVMICDLFCLGGILQLMAQSLSWVKTLKIIYLRSLWKNG